MIRSPQCSGHDLAKRFNRPGHAKGRIQRAGQTAEDEWREIISGRREA
jgi:hypothetical protein